MIFIDQIYAYECDLQYPWKLTELDTFYGTKLTVNDKSFKVVCGQFINSLIEVMEAHFSDTKKRDSESNSHYKHLVMATFIRKNSESVWKKLEVLPF